MESIAHKRGHWQPVKVRPIEVFKAGVSIPKRGFVFVPDILTDPKRKQRGEITEFSNEARKRLRRALLTESIPDTLRVGVTYTVPWKGEDFEPLMDEFRDCWHRFGVLFRRRFPNSAMIYRVELQERGAPHIHALTYIKYPDGIPAVGGAPAVPPSAGDAVLALENLSLRDMWSQSVIDLHHGSFNAFEKYGVKVEPIANDGAMYRYICDHTSKRKQAQLGYKGKQWGRVGGSNLLTAAADTLPDFISDRHAVKFFRLLRKVTRYRVTDYRRKRPWKHPPPFGSILRGSKRSVGEFYISGDTVRKMWEVTKCA